MARIHVLREKRDQKRSAAHALIDAAETDGNRLLSEEESKQFDGLEAEIKALDKGIAREEVLIEQDRDPNAGPPSAAPVEVHDRRIDRPWGPEIAKYGHPSAQDEAEMRRMALGEFAIAVRMATTGRGMDPRLMAAATGMGESIPSEGGFAVPPEIAPGIERLMFAGGEILSRVDVRTVGGNSMTYNVIDETSRADGSRQGGILGYWVDEGTAPTASKFKLAQMEMKLRKVGALSYMTDELLEDAPALGAELEQSFVSELVFQVENKIVRGTGGKVPLGWMNAPCLVSIAKETNQAAATINVTNISKMWARLPARSKATAVWLINVDCEPQLDELALAVGTGGLQPRFVNYGPSGILTMKGRPVIAVEYAETIGTKGDIVLVDLSQYRLIRKGGIEQARSMHVKFIEGEETFRAFYRVDGQPVPRAAITPFKGTDKISPFVSLDTRA